MTGCRSMVVRCHETDPRIDELVGFQIHPLERVPDRLLDRLGQRAQAPGHLRPVGRAEAGGAGQSVDQGQALGVSMGQIMRTIADEMRKRRKAAAEERAQKAPIKMLFPLLIFIFPSLFVIILLPAILRIADVL